MLGSVSATKHPLLTLLTHCSPTHPTGSSKLNVIFKLNVQRLLRSKWCKPCEYNCLNKVVPEINQKARNEKEIEGSTLDLHSLSRCHGKIIPDIHMFYLSHTRHIPSNLTAPLSKVTCCLITASTPPENHLNQATILYFATWWHQRKS